MVEDPRHSRGEMRQVLMGSSERRRLLAVMFTEREEVIRLISARKRQGGNEKAMKTSKTKSPRPSRRALDEILPEYDFNRARPNKYASRYRAGSSVVVLDPDVAAAFPNGRAVNQALRSLAARINKKTSRRTA